MTGNWGQYIVRVDGAIPRGQSGLSSIAGIGKRGPVIGDGDGYGGGGGDRQPCRVWGYSEGA